MEAPPYKNTTLFYYLQKGESKVIHMTAAMPETQESVSKKQKVGGINQFEALKAHTVVVADTGEINAIKE